MKSSMKGSIFFMSMMTLMCGVTCDASLWKGEEDAKKPRCPFSVENVAAHCETLEIEGGMCRVPMYSFEMFPELKNDDVLLRGEDSVLHLQVKLQFVKKNPLRVRSCIVRSTEKPEIRDFEAAEITAFKVDSDKTIYIASFRESRASLVIYKKKYKVVMAHWAIISNE